MKKRNPFADFTPRESDIYNAMLDGGTLQDVANRVMISVAGVKFHRDNILAKLNIRNRLDLAIYQHRDMGGKWLEGGKGRVSPALTPSHPANMKAAA